MSKLQWRRTSTTQGTSKAKNPSGSKSISTDSTKPFKSPTCDTTLFAAMILALPLPIFSTVARPKYSERISRFSARISRTLRRQKRIRQWQHPQVESKSQFPTATGSANMFGRHGRLDLARIYEDALCALINPECQGHSCCPV